MRYRLKLATYQVVREAGEPSPRILKDSASVARLGLDLARDHDDEKERFWVVLLDGKNRAKLIPLVSVGSLNASIVHPREVFRLAVGEGAGGIVLIHNHPSGDPEPSPEDHEVTERLVNAGRVLGIRVLDHVVVGNGTDRWTSFQERGMLA
jgi:DNA repair protein RadC